jgi:hypothetical protein
VDYNITMHSFVFVLVVMAACQLKQQMGLKFDKQQCQRAYFRCLTSPNLMKLLEWLLHLHLEKITLIFSSLFYTKVWTAFGQEAVLMLTRHCVDLQQNTLVFQQHLQVSNDRLVLQGLLLEHEEADYPLLLLNSYYSEWNRLQLAELVIL